MIVNQGQLYVSPTNFMVSLPKFLKWFAKDFISNDNYDYFS
jgi:hypothetical protein